MLDSGKDLLIASIIDHFTSERTPITKRPTAAARRAMVFAHQMADVLERTPHAGIFDRPRFLLTAGAPLKDPR